MKNELTFLGRLGGVLFFIDIVIIIGVVVLIITDGWAILGPYILFYSIPMMLFHLFIYIISGKSLYNEYFNHNKGGK